MRFSTNREIRRRRSQQGQESNWKKRTSKILLVFFLLFALVSGIAGTVYGVKKWMHSCSYFFISSIKVQGASRLTKKDIVDFSGIKQGDNIFSVDLKAVSGRLNSHPWIKFAEVERRLPDTILIRVDERQPVALARVNGTLFLVDKDGTCFKPLEESDAFSAPVITGIGDENVKNSGNIKGIPGVDSAKMADALRIIKMSRAGVRALGYNNISQIDFPDKQEVVIYTADKAVPFHLDRRDIKHQFYRAEKILFQLYNSGQYPRVVSVTVDYGKDMALARIKKK